MRSIQVSADLYAAIWKRQEPGEISEEEILRRVLGCTPSKLQSGGAQMPDATIGIFDRRNNVKFPAGFEVFRIYKGKQYRAHARGGLWYREDTGEAFPSLNQLSDSIGASEDAWQGWLYRDDTGHVSKVHSLRRTANGNR
jgi:hypothetical protein